MKTGFIKRLKESFGFIRADDGQEYFFLPMKVKNVPFSQLSEGQRVSFEEEQHERGMRAVEIEAEV